MSSDDEKVNMESGSQYNRLSCQLFGKPVVIIADIKHVHEGQDTVIEKKLFTNSIHENNEKSVLGRCVVCYSFISQNQHQIMLGRRRGRTEQTNVLTELLNTLVPQPNLDIPVEKEVFSVSSSWFCRNCSSVCQQLLSSKSKQEPVTELRERIIATIQLSMLIAEKQVNSAIKNEYEKHLDLNNHTSILLQTKAVDKIRECLINEMKLKYKRLPKQEKTSTAQVKVGDCTKSFNLVHCEDVTISKSKQQNPSTRLPCEIFGAVLTRPLLLRNKEVLHLGIKEFACTQCGKVFALERDLDAHLRCHTGERLSCEFCDAKFMSKLNLREHVQKQHGHNQMSALKESGGVICDICGATLASRAILNRHKRVIHFGIKRHACSHCQKRFGTRLEMTNHIRQHTGEKPFACPNCDRRFALKQNLNRHLSNCQPNRQTNLQNSRMLMVRLIPCNFCPRRFKTKYTLNRHVKLDHAGFPVHQTSESEYFASVVKAGQGLWKATEENLYFCDLEIMKNAEGSWLCPLDCCLFSSPQRANLVIHINRTHADPSNYQCNECELKFYYECDLVEHVRVQHVGKYKCDICDEKLSNRDAFNRHKSTVHGPNFPYACKYCDKGFSLRCDLSKHVNSCHASHSGERVIKTYSRLSARQFECGQCDAKFCYRSQLVRHQSVHTDGKFACNFCDQRFALMYVLKQHVQEKHSNLLQLSLTEKDEDEAGVAVEAVKDEPCMEDEEKIDVVHFETVKESDIILPEVLWKTDKSFDPFQIY